MNTTITTGRIVQYMDAQSIAWPAIVTIVDRDNGEITLTVFDNSMTTPGIKASLRPVQPKDKAPGAWWWPEVNPPAKKPEKEAK